MVWKDAYTVDAIYLWTQVCICSNSCQMVFFDHNSLELRMHADLILVL